jgi:ABC-2 type transport system ATP-binding protein
MSTLTFQHVTKRFGAVTALDDFTAVAQPGRITAFLGSNGSGKTTSMRVLLGLSDPTSGCAALGGVRYRDLPHPQRIVGAVLDTGLHPSRTARNHLRVVAALAQVPNPRDRVDEVLHLLDLDAAAGRRVGGFSLGMRQRLTLAAALLPSPSALVLDEPYNGLDPDGIRTMRRLLRDFADRGGTVLLSSHLLAEVAHSADELIVIDRGRLVTAGPLTEIVRPGDDLESAFHHLVHPDADRRSGDTLDRNIHRVIDLTDAHAPRVGASTQGARS